VFVDAATIPAGTRLEFDICVVGAGAAGIAITRALVGSSLRVGLLESGGFQSNQGAQDLYRGEATGIPYFPLEATRARYFGGTTNLWAGWCHPFQERDFEARDWIPHSGWPIRFDDLEPYYEPAGEVCGVERPGRLLAGVQRSDPSDFGESFQARMLQRAPEERRRLGRTFRDELRDAAAVTCILHANVLDLHLRPDRSGVEIARVGTLGGNRFTVEARAFVLATGGIENARVLLVSDGQSPEGLGNEHGQVGRFFLENPRFVAGVLNPTDPLMDVAAYGWRRQRGASVRDYLDLGPDLKERESLRDVVLRLEPVYAESFAGVATAPAVDAARQWATGTGEGAGASAFARQVQMVARDLMSWQRGALPGAPLPVPRAEVLRRLFSSGPVERRNLFRGVFGDLAAFGLMTLGGVPLTRVNVTAILQPEPNPESRITLSSERDAVGVRRSRLDWRLTADDLRSVRRTMEIFASAVGHAGAGRVQLLHGANGGEWPEETRGGWHHMGTTRMSEDPRHGVVDRDCRVHGVPNLFVAGSSVFPTSGSGSPTLTLVALALRLADHLKRIFT
jgi:choline dehydrogenase-like flavoprotein